MLYNQLCPKNKYYFKHTITNSFEVFHIYLWQYIMLTAKNCALLATLGHFEIVGAENGKKPKSGIFITQPLLLTVLPYLSKNNCFWGWEISRIGEDILLYNDSFSKSKMAPNHGQWKVSIPYLCKRRVPLVVATKHVCVTLIPFWNSYYWFKHTKTNIARVFCIYWWQIGVLKVQNVGYIASLKPLSKCGPWKNS